MPFARPPADMPLNPVTWTLAEGGMVWRVHRKTYSSNSFNPHASHQYFGGARFDGTKDDDYAFLYAGSSPRSALAETLVRNIPASDDGLFYILRRTLEERVLSPLVTRRSISLIDLRQERGIREVSQDSWLVTAPENEYAQTRHWGHWIRRNYPVAAGFIWRSKRCTDDDAMVLFGDRCGTDALELAPAEDPIALDETAGIDFINSTLRSIRCIVDV